MSRGNNNNNNNDDDGGWGSKFLKVASAVTAAAVAAGGLYALLSSASSEQQPPFEESGSRRVIKETDDEYHDDHDDTPSYQIIRWQKPEFGCVKLNVDGSCDHISDPRSAGCGGVLRDSSGTWLFGFSQKLDPSLQPHETEIEAILKGLELVLGMNYKKLVVESDNESVVSMVQDVRKGKNHQQYDRIRELLSNPYYDVVYVHRDANKVANRLARDARDMPLGTNLRKYSYPPTNCVSMVEEDARMAEILLVVLLQKY